MVSYLEDQPYRPDFRRASQGLIKAGLVYENQYGSCLLNHFGTPEVIKTALFLDIGSGIGNPLQDLVRKYGARVVSLDLDERVMHDLALERKRAILGSIYRIPCKTASVDGVLCSEVVDTVPHFVDDLFRIFKEAHRVLKPGGLFIQRHVGVGWRAIPKAEEQLTLLSQAGFHKIQLLEIPDSEQQLFFSAAASVDVCQLPEALKSNYDWVYRKAKSNEYGRMWRPIYQDERYLEASYWDKEVIKKNLSESFVLDKPLLLLLCLRSIILQFWPERQDDYFIAKIAADFNYQFVTAYSQYIDEDYCEKNDLDPSTAREFYEKYGLRAVIDSWIRGELSEFSFFGKSSHEKLIFDPGNRTVTYRGNLHDPEQAAIQKRFDDVFGPKGIEIL